MNRPKVMLADAHMIMMEGVRSLLAERAEVVGMYMTARELLESVPRVHPEVVILEIALPDLNGIEVARRLRESAPQTKVIFLTQRIDHASLNEALKLGISGYLLKRSAFSELLSAIEGVQQGHPYITPLVNPASRPAGSQHAEENRDDKLTTRERDVLRLTAEGRSAKEIATALKISVKTVQFHKANLTRKLGMRTTAELVKYAVRRGFTAP